MKKAPESGVRIIHPRLMFNLLMYRCMETKNFEINGEFRAMDMAELAYILTNQESVSMMVKEQEVVYGNVCTLDEVIYKMTPARKKLVLGLSFTRDVRLHYPSILKFLVPMMYLSSCHLL